MHDPFKIDILYDYSLALFIQSFCMPASQCISLVLTMRNSRNSVLERCSNNWKFTEVKVWDDCIRRRYEMHM